MANENVQNDYTRGPGLKIDAQHSAQHLNIQIGNMTSPGPQILKDFSQLLSRYDGFILDQYGVLHNGTHILPGVLELLHLMKSQSKKMMILSNSSKRAKTTLNGLVKYDIPKNVFIGGAMTSGEQAWHTINSTPRYQKCCLFGWMDNSSSIDFVESLEPKVTLSSIEEADFILAHGTQRFFEGIGTHENQELAFYDDGDFSSKLVSILRQGVQHKLPLLCGNPDFISVYAGDKFCHMPGKIARKYQELGGDVTYFGKPQAHFFNHCVDTLQIEKHRILHVGDSLTHDIKGANGAGIDSVFVANGVHAKELDLSTQDGRGMEINPEKLNQLCTAEGAVPTYAVPAFSL